jgi:hypothetical protein
MYSMLTFAKTVALKCAPHTYMKNGNSSRVLVAYAYTLRYL